MDIVNVTSDRYRLIVELVQEGIWEIDDNSVTTYVNPRMAEMLGYRCDEMLGKTIFEFMDDRAVTIAKAGIERQKQGITEHHDFEFLKKDGTRIYAELTTAPILKDGQDMGAIAVISNVTERRRSVDALRERSELFAQFMRNSPIYIYLKEVTPTASRVLMASENYRDMIGIPGSEMVGKTMEELFPAELAQKMTADDWATVFDGKVLRLDEDFNGHHYTSIKFPLFQESKSLLGGYTIDITERKRAEDNEARYRRVIEQSADGIVIANSAGTITEWNKAQENITGVKRSEAVGRPLWEVQTQLAPKDISRRELSEQLQIGIKSILQEGSDWTGQMMEQQILRLDGLSRIVQDTSFVVQNGPSRELGVIMRDITDLKQAEKENANVQAQLLHSAKLASIGTLAAGMAHEINNPLAIVIGLTGLLEKYVRSGETDAILQITERQKAALKRIVDVVSGLRTFARMDTNEIEAVDFHMVIDNVVAMCGFVIGKHGAQLNIAKNSKSPIVSANIGKLQQVLMNLLTNAKDAFNDGQTGHIKIETHDEDGFCVMSVADDGCGMLPAVQSRIFDPFFTTKDAGKGTGLGLSISKSIIESFGGTVSVESKVGIGSTFTVRLPVAKKQ